MNDDARTKLIRLEMTDPAIRREMDSMTNYKLGFVRALTKADIERIDNYGFRFRAKTLAGKREEIKNYIQEHPSLRGDSVASIKSNFKKLGKLAEEIGRPDEDSDTETSSSDDSSSSSTPPPKRKSKAKQIKQLKKSPKKTPKKSPKKKSKTLSESSSPDSSTDDSVKTSKSKANSKKSKTDTNIVPLNPPEEEDSSPTLENTLTKSSDDDGDIF